MVDIYTKSANISTRTSYKEFGHSHWWELIEIFVPKFGIWFSSLFPEWELIPTGIPTGGNWLKYLIPNLGFDSPAYSQSGNWFPQEFPLVGIDWNIWSQIRFIWIKCLKVLWTNSLLHFSQGYQKLWMTIDQCYTCSSWKDDDLGWTKIINALDIPITFLIFISSKHI